MKPTIREATLDDLSSLRSLEQKLIEIERPFDSCLKEGLITYYDLENLIVSPDSHVVAVDTGDKVVGSGYAQFRDSKSCFAPERHCYLGFIYVDQDFRGSGLAKGIIESLTEWAVSNGASYFLLDVYSANQAAIRAYEKYGFKTLSVKMELKI